MNKLEKSYNRRRHYKRLMNKVTDSWWKYYLYKWFGWKKDLINRIEQRYRSSEPFYQEFLAASTALSNVIEAGNKIYQNADISSKKYEEYLQQSYISINNFIKESESK